MRIETREVTETRKIYISDDGREFFDPGDCRDHEYEILSKTFKCYDINYKESDPESGMYANLVTDESVRAFIQCCAYIGVTSNGVGTPGLYMFNDYSESWISMDEVMFRIRGGLTNDKD